MAGVGGGSGASRNWLRCTVLGQFRSKVDGERGSLGQRRSGKHFYGTDPTRSLWYSLVCPRSPGVRTLSEIYAGGGGDGEVELCVSRLGESW